VASAWPELQLSDCRRRTGYAWAAGKKQATPMQHLVFSWWQVNFYP
jgi:hypothetical protein